MLKKIIYLLVITISISSCRILTPSIMLRTPPDYSFDTPSDTISALYEISPYDIVNFQLHANDGFKIIDLYSTMGNSGNNNRNLSNGFGGIGYTIDEDGYTKLPILGRTKLSGMTIRECELFLEEKFSTYYNDPFVLVRVSNRRILYFPGNEGSVRVIPLSNNNTTLMEAIARGGGITNRGKAHRIKVIRGLGELEEPEVYLIDLSKIDGLEYADMVMQANDIIYVDTRLYYASEIVQEITPFISLITTITTAIVLITTLRGN